MWALVRAGLRPAAQTLVAQAGAAAARHRPAAAHPDQAVRAPSVGRARVGQRREQRGAALERGAPQAAQQLPDHVLVQRLQDGRQLRRRAGRRCQAWRVRACKAAVRTRAAAATGTVGRHARGLGARAPTPPAAARRPRRSAPPSSAPRGTRPRPAGRGCRRCCRLAGRRPPRPQRPPATRAPRRTRRARRRRGPAGGAGGAHSRGERGVMQGGGRERARLPGGGNARTAGAGRSRRRRRPRWGAVRRRCVARPVPRPGGAALAPAGAA
jgi:hypothetical protein